MAANCSRAAWRSSTISAAMTSGAGRFADSSSEASLSQKMSRLALSRLTGSSWAKARKRSLSVRSWRFSGR
jgi:hypothetical protein